MATALDRVFILRDRLQKALSSWIGQPLVTEVFWDFTHKVSTCFPRISDVTIFQTTNCLLGTTLTANSLYEFAWRLAGNVAELKKGKSALPWTAASEPAWHPAQILEATHVQLPDKSGKLRPACRYRLRILAGPACPMTLPRTWTSKFIYYISRRVFGFSGAYGAYPFQSPLELVSLRLEVQLDNTLGYHGLPGFEQLRSAGPLKKWNRSIMRARQHIDPPCPESYTHPCHHCHVGYDCCPAAVHPRSYEWKFCVVCKQETWHDPLDNHCMMQHQQETEE